MSSCCTVTIYSVWRVYCLLITHHGAISVSSFISKQPIYCLSHECLSQMMQSSVDIASKVVTITSNRHSRINVVQSMVDSGDNPRLTF